MSVRLDYGEPTADNDPPDRTNSGRGSSPSHRWLFRGVFVLALTLFLGVLGYLTVERGALREHKRSDFPIYLAAARAVWNGGADLYTVNEPGGLYYIYPPPFAVLLVPFSWMPKAVAVASWYVINIALLALGLRFALVVATPPGKPLRPTLLVVPLLICADPLLTTITRGQLGIVMFASAAVALKWHLDGAQFRSGFLTTFAALIKVYPALLVFCLVFRCARRGDWRALWGVLAAAMAFGVAVPLAAFGPSLAASHWMHWATRIAFPFSRPASLSDPLFQSLTNPDLSNNASIGASLTHLAAIVPGFESPAARAWIRPVAVGVSAVLILALPLAWRRANGALKHYAPVLEWSSAVLVGIVAMPVAHVHYFGMLVLPLTAVACFLHYEPPGRAADLLRRSVVAVAVLAGVFVFTSIVRAPLEAFPPLRHGVMVVRGLGAYCWAALLLCGVFFYLTTGRRKA